MRKRNISTCVILSIITCGIYPLFWMAGQANDINDADSEGKGPSGGMVVFLSIITCGIYRYFWAYRAGSFLDERNIKQKGKSTNFKWLLLGLKIGVDFLTTVISIVAVYFITPAMMSMQSRILDLAPSTNSKQYMSAHDQEILDEILKTSSGIFKYNATIISITSVISLAAIIIFHVIIQRELNSFADSNQRG